MAHYPDSALAEFLRFQRLRAQESHKKSIGMGTMRSIESAEILAQFDAAAARLQQLASLSALQQQFLALTLRIDPTATPAPAQESAPAPVRYRTGTQYEEITKLLNHPSFSKADRTQGLLKLNTLTEEAAPAYIATLRAALPSAQQIEQVETLLSRSCFTPAAREQGRRKLAELNRAGAASYIPVLQQLASDLERQLATASTPAQATARPPVTSAPASTHPALVASPYEQARAAYRDVLRHPRIKSEERDTALAVIDDWSEAKLRAKAAAVAALIQQRETQATAQAVAA